MQENVLSSGKYYTAGKDFTRRVSRDKSHLCSLYHYLELFYHFSISTSSSLIILVCYPSCQIVLIIISSWSVVLLPAKIPPTLRHTRILRLLLIFHRSHLSTKQGVHWILDTGHHLSKEMHKYLELAAGQS